MQDGSANRNLFFCHLAKQVRDSYARGKLSSFLSFGARLSDSRDTISSAAIAGDGLRKKQRIKM